MPLPTTHTPPLASRETDAVQCLDALAAHPTLAPLLANSTTRARLAAAAGNAPYLARLMQKYPEQLIPIVSSDNGSGFHAAWAQLMIEAITLDFTTDTPTIMRRLRQLKARAALTIALADISGVWKLAEVTRALSDFAGHAVGAALRHLLHQAAKRGDIAPTHPEEPEAESGIIVLGMGKLGAYELNYSSDIDLIILFEHETLPYRGARNAQVFMNKLAGDLVTLLQERNEDGYVFRTDLRLRPDPMSTPLAVTTAAALSYYETVGQNWERAAMIKARPIAGDPITSAAYMRELVPFIWRKTLDFATIADINSIKRQMNVKTGREIALHGHNIKTGMGGIREIEFFVQTQQLVWGGRIPELRVKGTLEGLAQLTHYELVSPDARDTLTASYQWLRMVEHRLQMRADEQTHSLPTDDAGLHEVSLFAGYENTAHFAADCLATLTRVQTIYTESMEDAPPLAVDGNLVFTGVEADPETLTTLAQLGYKETKRISDIIQGWHRGHRRSTRSKRSRQVLTELVPALLTALGKTANPDAAFFNFDEFIDRLPSGAQIFSLFLSRPEMLSLLADILGSAPALGETLSNNPSLLDSVLEADFFLGLPSKDELQELVTERLRYAHAFEQKMIYLRSFNNEKRFQAGVHLLKRLATPKRVGAFLSDIAEIILQCVLLEVWAEYGTTLHELAFKQKRTNALQSSPHAGEPNPPTLASEIITQPAKGDLVGGTLPHTPTLLPPTETQEGFGSPSRGELGASLTSTHPTSATQATIPFAVLALGKLGGREMTFGSDLDIILLYDDAGDAASEIRTHLTRLSQRFLSALTLLTREGRLYEVDTRLRPGGADGPLAVSLTAFDAYFEKSAWTYEFMALSRARVVASNAPEFAKRIAATVKRHILKPRDPEKLRQDVADMRARIAKQFPSKNPWALKHMRGGMVDQDFIAQYLVLRDAHAHPELWKRNARAVFEQAHTLGVLEEATASALIAAKKFETDLMSLLRLSAPGGVITDDAPIGLKMLLTRTLRQESFDSLKAALLHHEAATLAAYEHMLGDAAPR